MKKSIAIADLRPGMYVILPLTWINHPFLRNRFKLKNAQQIRELAESGLREVQVDLDKSDPEPEPSQAEPPIEVKSIEELAYVSHNDQLKPPETPIADPKEAEPPPIWTPDKLIDPELREAIRDQNLSPQKKSRVVYSHTRQMMERLLESPTAENIGASKQVISDITDMVLQEEETAQGLLRITNHDFYTYTHSVNVGVIALMLAKALLKRSDGHDMHELASGFFLHDLGKIKVDPAIINKPARLDDNEMRRMRIHPYQGYKILKAANQLSEESRVIIMEHHELFDGNGYPKRLKGDQIHLYGRICCIADVFDALTAERSYKKAMTPFDALKLMRDKMTNHFDKPLFTSFVTLFNR